RLAGFAQHDFLACVSLVQQVREMRFGVVDVDNFVHAVEASPACWLSQLDSRARLGMVRTPRTTRLHAATARMAHGSVVAGQPRLAGPLLPTVCRSAAAVTAGARPGLRLCSMAIGNEPDGPDDDVA